MNSEPLISQLSEQGACGHESRLMAKKFSKNNDPFNGEERKKEIILGHYLYNKTSNESGKAVSEL